MTKRPRAPGYTGLFLRGSGLYYDRQAKGKPRGRFSTSESPVSGWCPGGGKDACVGLAAVSPYTLAAASRPSRRPEV